MKKKTLKKIEVVCGAIVMNTKGEVLLVKSKKWVDKWVLCGGHVNPGEKILDAAKREVKEETNLNTKPVKIIKFYELINPKEFNRPVHFLAFRCLLKVEGKQKIKLNNELRDYIWAKPRKALKMNVTKIHLQTIKELIKIQK